MPERRTLEFTHGKNLNRFCAIKDEIRELQAQPSMQPLCHGSEIHILQIFIEIFAIGPTEQQAITTNAAVNLLNRTILRSLKLRSIGRGIASVYKSGRSSSFRQFSAMRYSLHNVSR